MPILGTETGLVESDAAYPACSGGAAASGAQVPRLPLSAIHLLLAIDSCIS
jgi:hypothetical protein